MGRSRALTKIAKDIDANGNLLASAISPDVTLGGATVYADRASLPVSGNSDGDQAYVTENNRLYIWNGSGWYSVALLNVAPAIASVQDSDGNTTPFLLSSEGAVTRITIIAADADGDPITYSAAADSDFSGLATISQDANVFTITPFSLDSASTTSGTITFTATDGINIASSIQAFTLSFVSPYWDETVLSIGTSGSGWNLSGAVSTGTNISLASTAEHFSSDGLTLITVNSLTQVGSHDLSTAYDMSTITTSQSYNISEETSLEDARFSSDGTKMYVIGITNDTVYQYSLSTAYDVSTASYDSVSFAVGAQESGPRAMAFKSDGTKMYISGNSGDDINEYDLSTAWDVSTASYSQVFTYGIQTTPLNIEFSPDGTKLFVYGSSSHSSHPSGSGIRVIDRWDLSTAWDVSTMAYHSSLADPIGVSVFGMTFNNDGTTLYVSTSTVVYAFDMSVNTNSNFIDRSTNAHTVTPTGSPVQTAFHPYLDNWSVEFDGTGDNLLLGYDSSFYLSGDFTIECWIYANAYGGMILNFGGGLSIAWASFELVNQSDGIYFAGSSTNTGYDIGSESDTTGRIGTIELATWNHIAVTRSGNVYRGFVNGVQGYTQTLALTPYDPSTRGIAIGSNYATTWGTGTPTNVFNGNISNLRIVKGTALYTENFTPPIAKLTAVSGTSLLTCQSNRYIDNSTNTHAIAANGDSKVSASNPFGQESEYTAGENKGSLYSPDNDSKVGTSTLSSLNLGTQDFCVEGWWLQTDKTDAYPRGWSMGPAYSSGSLGITMDDNDSANVVTFYVRTFDTGRQIYGTKKINDGAWHHIAITREGSSFKLFVDGEQDGSTYTNSGAVTSANTGFYVANAQSEISGEGFVGYVSDIKIVVGNAVYTSNFTPPTSPVGNTNASLYLPMDNAGFYDKTGNNTLTPVGNVSTSTTQTKFTDTAIYFDGTGYLVLPYTASNLEFSSNFTVECWVNLTSKLNNFPCIINNYSTFTTNGGFAIFASHNSGTSGKYNIAFNGSFPAINSTTSISYGTWQHIALVRSGSTITLYVDGIANGTITSTATVKGTANNWWIGAAGDSPTTSEINGYIENLQILKGVAKYTQNFTPPILEQGKTYQAES